MAVKDGPAHIGSNSHKARLAQFNASALASRIKELTLLHSSFSKESISILPVAHIKDQQYGITDCVQVSAEFSRHPTTAIPSTLQRTAEPTQTKAKLRNAVTVSAPPGAVPWTCTLCNRKMQAISRVDHLAGKAHARKLIPEISTVLVPLHVNSTISGTPEANKTKGKRIAKSNLAANRLLQSWTSDGPLDNFFHSHHSFHYDASTPPAISFESLQSHLQKRHKWSRGGPECKELWHRYQTALTQEFNLWFGVEDDLNAWHSLCRAVRITPLPTTCELCRSSVRGRHVNIIDLIEWGRSGGKYVRIFRTVKELSDYSYDSRKIYSKQAVDELEAGAVLKHLLRPLEAAQY
ncbi:MAG: hypothetical protein Q9187_006235 [Circinaria calcarea]